MSEIVSPFCIKEEERLTIVVVEGARTHRHTREPGDGTGVSWGQEVGLNSNDKAETSRYHKVTCTGITELY